ncbi:Hypothetical protein EHI5A_211470 [Entamoeba histolytica KU27]|uniref:Uncharacterized protein n=1 Tax=Entamoeba histolytica KU27 TaxID=885311 RepID=M2RZS3_ENTHI|nr:Hypothetical protein EHI5A_211470 [Entamoeba histolytica KU27]
MTTSIKDIIADFALGKYKEMGDEELIETMNKLMYIIDDETSTEEKVALKKPYWSLVYRIANKKGLMWNKPQIKKVKTPEVPKKEYKTKFVLKDKKKEEETKPKKEDN